MNQNESLVMRLNAQAMEIIRLKQLVERLSPMSYDEAFFKKYSDNAEMSIVLQWSPDNTGLLECDRYIETPGLRFFWDGVAARGARRKGTGRTARAGGDAADVRILRRTVVRGGRSL